MFLSSAAGNATPDQKGQLFCPNQLIVFRSTLAYYPSRGKQETMREMRSAPTRRFAALVPPLPRRVPARMAETSPA
jgi:hypothetical protein